MRNRVIVLSAALLLTSAAVVFGQPVASPVKSPGAVDFGVQSTSITGDEARFQRYRDLRNGAFVERLRFNREGDGWLFDASADHVGRRDQRYSAVYRNGGKVKVSFEWDQVPQYFSNITRTLYSVESPGVLRIADSIQSGIQAGTTNIANVAGLATPFDTRSRRDIASFRVIYSPTRELDLKFALKTARREGTMPWAASFGFSNAVEVAVPLDTRTTDVTSGLEYTGPRGSLRVAYDGSWFNNNVPALTWDNPLRISDTTFAGAYSSGLAGSLGRMALWPSTSTQGVSTSGALKLPARTRLTANISVGRVNQDEALLPFTTNTAIPTIPLDRATADINVRTLAMNYNVNSQPNKYVWLNARYRYYDFDNHMPEFNMDTMVVFDQVTRVSHHPEPLSYTRQNVDLDASFTPLPFTAVKVGYGREQVDRTHRIFDETVDSVFRASVDSSAGAWLTLRAIVERGDRVGSGFEQEALVEVGEQPALRHFDVADRERNRVTGLVQLTPRPEVGFTFSASSGKDDYSNSGFGLRDNENKSYSFSVDLTPVETVVAGVSYTNETLSASQRSRNATVPTADGGLQFNDPRRDWTTDAEDKVRTLTANLDLLRALPRTELRFAYDTSRSRATYVYGVPSNSTLVAPQQLPAITNELRSGTADLRYFLTEKLAIGFVYWYNRYEVTDYAMNTSTINQINMPGTLFLNYVLRPYTAHSSWLRMTYLW